MRVKLETCVMFFVLGMTAVMVLCPVVFTVNCYYANFERKDKVVIMDRITNHNYISYLLSDKRWMHTSKLMSVGDEITVSTYRGYLFGDEQLEVVY